MNEQIAKLANESGFDVDKTGSFGNYSEMHRLEKFAELIVRECAEVAKKEQAFNARYTDADKHPQVNIDQCILIEFGL
jgi:hypothetical protein